MCFSSKQKALSATAEFWEHDHLTGRGKWQKRAWLPKRCYLECKCATNRIYNKPLLISVSVLDILSSLMIEFHHFLFFLFQKCLLINLLELWPEGILIIERETRSLLWYKYSLGERGVNSWWGQLKSYLWDRRHGLVAKSTCLFLQRRTQVWVSAFPEWLTILCDSSSMGTRHTCDAFI